MAELEYDTKTIPLDQELAGTLQQLQEQGWDLVPGTKPLVTYQLVREKRSVGPAEGILQLDDSKIFVIKAGA